MYLKKKYNRLDKEESTNIAASYVMPMVVINLGTINLHSGAKDSLSLASRPGRLKYGLVSIAWVIVHMRKLSSPESGEFVHVSKPL